MAKITFRPKEEQKKEGDPGFFISVKEAKYLRKHKNYKKALILSIFINVLLVLKLFI